MTPTYGRDQEAAARALSGLLRIRPEDLPADRDTQLHLLRCREAAFDALIERVAMLGVDQNAVSGLLRSRQPLNVSAFHRPGGALTWLTASLRAAPRLPVELRHSPADALATSSDDPAVEGWRTAGRHLLSATHRLREDTTLSWKDAATGWGLLDDVSVAADALTALDAEAGTLLSSYCVKDGPFEPDRLGFSVVQRLAAWHGDHHDQLDNARRAPDLRPVPGTVEVIDSPVMFKVAHQRLQAFLELRSPGQGAPNGVGSRDVMDRVTAVIALGAQAAFVDALETTLVHAGSTWAPLAMIAGEQRERLAAVRANLTALRLRNRLDGRGGGLADDRRVAVMHPVVLQSRELHRGASLAAQVPEALDLEDVAEVLGRSHQVQRLIAERIRREIVREHGSLGVASTTDRNRTAADIRKTGLGKALIAMRDAEPPPQARRVHTHTSREQLRLHLEAAAPAGMGHPSPYGGRTAGPTL